MIVNNRKNTTKLTLIIGLYLLLYLGSRLPNLLDFPIFIDETLHLNWAKATWQGDIFASFRDGFRLTYAWVAALALPFFTEPLLAGRVVSVLAGLLSGIICYFLARRLYPQRPYLGYLAMFIYLVSPFALFYDRLALSDSLLTMLMGLSLLVSLRLWSTPSLKWAIILGIVLGVAILTKIYALLYGVMPLLCWLILGRRKLTWPQIAGLLGLVAAMVMLAISATFILGLKHWQEDISHKILSSPAQVDFQTIVLHNFWSMSEWFTYFTLPYLGLLIFTLALIFSKRDKPGLILITLVLLTLLFFVTVTSWVNRYALSVIIPLSILLARGLDELITLVVAQFNKLRPPTASLYPTVALIIFGLLSLPAIRFDYFIITNPEVAPFPASEREMYISGGMSGYAVRESIQFVGELAQQYPYMTVLLPRYTLNPTMRELYLPQNVNIAFQEIATPQDLNLQMLNDYAQKGPLLTIVGFDVAYDHALILGDGSNLYDSRVYPQTWQLASFVKPGGQWQFNIYQWLSLPDFAVHWFQQGGDPDPRVVWFGPQPQSIDPAGTHLEWPSTASTLEELQQHLSEAQAEYILMTPELVNTHFDLLSPFMTTEGDRLHLNQLPPGWRLAFAHPDLNCQWCLFQLRPPEQPTHFRFGENIELGGYDLAPPQSGDKEAIHLTLYWDSLGPSATSDVVFVHLLDSTGTLKGQLDSIPLQGKFPTPLWRSGDKLADRYTLSPTSTLAPGSYTLQVGLYDPETLERLPIDSVQTSDDDRAIELTTFTIR